MARPEIVICGDSGIVIQHPETASEPEINYYQQFIIKQRDRIAELEADNARLQETLQLIKDGSTPAKFLAGLALKGASAK